MATLIYLRNINEEVKRMSNGRTVESGRSLNISTDLFILDYPTVKLNFVKMTKVHWRN